VLNGRALFHAVDSPSLVFSPQFAVLSLCCVVGKLFIVADDDDDDDGDRYAEGEGRLIGEKSGLKSAAVMPEYQADGFAV
jgi:hypothetical protein